MEWRGFLGGAIVETKKEKMIHSKKQWKEGT
jgi:hypothetical protein